AKVWAAFVSAKFGAKRVAEASAGSQPRRFPTRRSSDLDPSTRQKHQSNVFSPSRPRARPCQGLGRILFREIRGEEGCGGLGGLADPKSPHAKPLPTVPVDAPNAPIERFLTLATTCSAMP